MNDPANFRAITTRRITAGIIALAAIALLIGGAFAGLVLEGMRDLSGAAAAFDPYILRVARFTLWQAVLSTLLSVGPALFVARALSRHPRFFGRSFILQLFALPLALPAIVAALGVLALYGRAGYFAGVLRRCWRPRLAGHLRPVRNPRRPCLLQSAARPRGFSSRRCDTCRPTSGGWRASSAWVPAPHSG